MIDYKAVIFDLDGTILDSLNVWKEVDKQFFKLKGINMPVDYKKNIKSMSALEAATYTKNLFGLEETEEELIQLWTKLAYDYYKDKVTLKPGALEYIMYLKQNGVKMAVATACEQQLYEVCLKKHKIYDFFDVIVDTKMAGYGKQQPNVYNLCLEKLGLEPKDVIAFEDIIEAVKTLKKIGIKVYAVYEQNGFENLDELIKESDEYITDFREMIE